jgi:hypothetical protein
MAETETLNNNALVSYDDMARYLGIDSDDDSVIDEITALINRVSKSIETYCDREFYIQEHTETYRGTGGINLAVDQYPITSVSGVWSSTSRTWDADTLVDTGDYYIARGGNCITWYESYFPKSNIENIRVIYTAGLFSTTATVPADLKLVCLKEVSRIHKLKDDVGLSSHSTDEGGAGGIDTMSFSTGEFMPETEQVLHRYLRRRLY